MLINWLVLRLLNLQGVMFGALWEDGGFCLSC